MKTIGELLLVEDDVEIARIIMDHLRKEGFYVTWASTGKEGWDDFKEETYDMILVDLMLPEMDGFTLSRKIRLESDIPLLIISAKHEEDSKIEGLGLGADDYLTKPFSLSELTARIHSHLRRYYRYMQRDDLENNRIVYNHDLTIDYENKIVYLEKRQINLTHKEIELLFLLAKNPFKTFSKQDLYEHVWQQNELDGNNTVTVHVKGLRTKLKDDSRSSKFIQTVWGEGYRFIGEREL